MSEIITFCVITLCVRNVITICVERLLHFALKIFLHFASMLLHFALVLHFALILQFAAIITFCGVKSSLVFLQPGCYNNIHIHAIHVLLLFYKYLTFFFGLYFFEV